MKLTQPQLRDLNELIDLVSQQDTDLWVTSFTVVVNDDTEEALDDSTNLAVVRYDVEDGLYIVSDS